MSCSHCLLFPNTFVWLSLKWNFEHNWAWSVFILISHVQFSWLFGDRAGRSQVMTHSSRCRSVKLPHGIPFPLSLCRRYPRGMDWPALFEHVHTATVYYALDGLLLQCCYIADRIACHAILRNMSVARNYRPGDKQHTKQCTLLHNSCISPRSLWPW